MIVTNLSVVEAQLAVILARLEDPVPYFDWVGAESVNAIRERITTSKVDPDGHSWAAWAPFTRAQRESKGNVNRGILWDSGDLLESIRFDVDGAFGVDIGTDIWYAPKQQDGDGKIPSREFVGWDNELLGQLAIMFVAHLEGVSP